MRVALAFPLLAACGFHVGVSLDAAGGDDASAIDARGDANGDANGDATVDAPEDASAFGDVDLIPPSQEYAGTTNWTADDLTLDTATFATSVPLPSGVTFSEGLQDNGMAIAVLRVNDFKVNTGKTLRVTGYRPFVILAGHDVTISGTIDLGGHGTQPGAGGMLPGPGVGGDGVHETGGADGGGGGAGYGTPGAKGGDSSTTAIGGTAGLGYGPFPLSLSGGSRGGNPPTQSGCTNTGGGAGGAILIFAQHKLDVSGGINAGGGGGAGGFDCGGTTYDSGAGGGAGGMIYLQTGYASGATLVGAGVLAANGGGGGAGACSGNATPGPGGDGALSTTTSAAAGIGCIVGGIGATKTLAATEGAPGFNAGGGGGGVGSIYYHAPNLASVTSSPTAAAR